MADKVVTAKGVTDPAEYVDLARLLYAERFEITIAEP